MTLGGRPTARSTALMAYSGRQPHRCPSVRALEADIGAWVNAWNDNPKPFVWTTTAKRILASLGRLLTRTSSAEHQRALGLLSLLGLDGAAVKVAPGVLGYGLDFGDEIGEVVGLVGQIHLGAERGDRGVGLVEPVE